MEELKGIYNDMRIWLNDLNDVWRIILPSSIKNHGYVHRNTTVTATFSHKRFYGMLNIAGGGAGGGGADPADSMGLIISKIFGARGRNVNVWPFWTDAQYLLKFLLCGREEPVKRVTDGSWGSVGGGLDWDMLIRKYDWENRAGNYLLDIWLDLC